MIKIGELNATAAHFVLYYKEDDKHGNRYQLYRTWFADGTKHRKLVIKYADLLSVTWFINDFIRAHNEEKKGRTKFNPAEVDKWIADYLN